MRSLNLGLVLDADGEPSGGEGGVVTEQSRGKFTLPVYTIGTAITIRKVIEIAVAPASKNPGLHSLQKVRVCGHALMRLDHLVDQIGEGSVDLISAILVQPLRIYSRFHVSTSKRHVFQCGRMPVHFHSQHALRRE